MKRNCKKKCWVSDYNRYGLISGHGRQGWAPGDCWYDRVPDHSLYGLVSGHCKYGWAPSNCWHGWISDQ